MKKVFVLLMLAILPLGAFAQKDTRETQSQITFDVPSNGPQGGVQQNYDRAKVESLVAQINEAKLNGDVKKSEQLQNELDRVSGNSSVKSNGVNNGPQVIQQTVNQPVQEGDYNLTIVNGTDANWSVATSTDRLTGRLYLVSTKYNATGSDTLKLFTSSNSGISWVFVSWLAYGSAVKFRNDELDIEAVNNGTTSYVFITAGYSFSGIDYSSVFRWTSAGAEYAGIGLYTAAAGNSFVNPRITSDNSKYTTGSYVYVILTQDSLLAGGLHALRTKYSLITSPFITTPVMTYRNFNTSSNSYFWNASGVADSTKLYSDIAYSDSAGFSKVVTVSNFYKLGFNNLYMVYTSDYGATLPTYAPQITEANINYKPRIASTGKDSVGSQNMVITYVRQFSATDWDPAYQRTVNNGVLWTFGYVDGSTDTTIYADVIAIPRVPNTFRFAYTTMTSNTSGKSFVRAYNGALIGTRLQLNTNPSSINYTPVRAGFRYSTDSCFTVVQGLPSSVGIYAYSGCTGTLTGFGNNETPLSYKLSQNYPNPFNPTTKISYALPKSGLVTLKVYDILGKEVATLVNEVKNAGNYSVDFGASNFTSGVYFYKLETNGFSDIKKMMLIK